LRLPWLGFVKWSVVEPTRCERGWGGDAGPDGARRRGGAGGRAGDEGVVGA
jgi:hypothetical protein